jgi:sn-glycerol 3-phosphate transport system ATP-binding protein
MIAGLEDVTEGEIDLDGNRINEIDPSERDIAMVFQNYALYPHMSVYNNIAYGLRSRGIKKTGNRSTGYKCFRITSNWRSIK